MFKSAYQDGDCVEIFSPAGKNPAVEWKLTNKVARLYDKGIKGYALAVSGGATSKMQIPKAPKGLLGLRQRYLVVQLLTATSGDKPFSLELGLTDVGGTRRRLVLSSSFRALHCTPLHAQIPLVGLDRHRGSWANLSVDLAGLTASCFRSDAFSTLDHLAIGPTCRIRKIFTMRGALDYAWEGGAAGPNGEGGFRDAPVEPLPLRMSFPAGVIPPPRNWVISPDTFRDRKAPEVPPPSPSDRSFSSPTSMGRRRSTRPVPSPRLSPLPRHVPPVSPAAVAVVPGAELVVSAKARHGRGHVQDETTKSMPGTPGRGGVLPAARLGSRSVLSGASSRLALSATPSPLATRSSGSNSVGRRRRTSFCADTLGPSTPGYVGDGGGGVSGGSRGVGGSRRVVAEATSRVTTASTTPLERTASHPSPLLGVASSRRAAQTLTAAGSGDVATEDNYHGRGAHKISGLPARHRASENAATAATVAAVTAAISSRISRDDVTGGGSSSDASTPSASAPRSRVESRQAKQVVDTAGGYNYDRGRKEPAGLASAEDWSAAISWNRRQDTPAPAWSFLDNTDDGDSRSSPPSTEPRREPSFFPQARACRPAVVPSPPTDTVTTAPGGPHRSPPPAFLAYGDRSGASSHTDRGIHDKNEEASPPAMRSPQLLSEVTVVPRSGGATRRRDQGGGGASVVSATRCGDPVLSSGSREHRSPPFVSRLSSSTAARVATAAAATAASTEFSTSVGSCRDENLRKEVRDLPNEEVVTAARFFTPPFSAAARQENPAHRLSSPYAAGASLGTVTSPMSARVDVLQALLASPTAAGDTPLVEEAGSGTTLAGERDFRTKVRQAGAAMAGDLRASGSLGSLDGSGGDGVRGRGDTGDETDALEHLLLRGNGSRNSSRRGATAVRKGRRISAGVDPEANCEGDVGTTTSVDGAAVERRTSSRQGGGDNDYRGGEFGVELPRDDRLRVSENEEVPSPFEQQRTSARRAVDALASDDEPLGMAQEATRLKTTEIGRTPARRRGEDDGAGGGDDGSGSPGDGGYRNESGLFPLARGAGEPPQPPLPKRLAGSEIWREEREGAGGQRTTPRGERPELEELERKEIALLDLEDSFHAEFGSVDLSQTPEARAPSSGDRSLASIVTPSGAPSGKIAPQPVSGGGGETGAVSFVDSPRRQRIGAHGATCGDRDDDADADSVVFGSPNGARDDDGSRNPIARVPARSRGEAGAVLEAASGRGGGRDTPSRVRGGGDNDLYFDPVLNCYYDRAADKYYGLPRR